jgi:hypothetical protein
VPGRGQRRTDPVVRELAAAQRQDPNLGIEGSHFFMLGGIASAADRANALLVAAPAAARAP